MTDSLRVAGVARLVGKASKEVILLCNSIGIDVKSPSERLTGLEVERVCELLGFDSKSRGPLDSKAQNSGQEKENSSKSHAATPRVSVSSIALHRLARFHAAMERGKCCSNCGYPVEDGFVCICCSKCGTDPRDRFCVCSRDAFRETTSWRVSQASSLSGFPESDFGEDEEGLLEALDFAVRQASEFEWQETLTQKFGNLD